MIYLFRIISDENPEFYRDLVIDGSDTFLDFHHTIQKDLGYDPTQLASFFITNELWEKQQEITLIDMMPDPDLPAITMDQALIEEYAAEDSQRMIYIFDFFSERALFIELIEQTDQNSPKKTPFIGHAEGEAPIQLSLDLLMDDLDLNSAPDEYDLEEGMGDLRIDDLDPDMLDSGIPEDF